MDWTSNVTVHESAFPDATQARLVDALKRREIDPFLLYSGLRQTARWIALHHALSPAQRDAACAALYEQAYRRAAEFCKGNVVHLVSLACGDGTKDTRCLEMLRLSGRTVIYTPADVSLEMALTAERTATTALRGLQCTPLLCELLSCSALPALLKEFDPSSAERIILFLGTIHNYWPPEILRSILYPLRSQDHLILSANLAPDANYESALTRIVSQYDNPLTRAWLLGALSELNITTSDGTLEFSAVPADGMPALRRIQADFVFTREKRLDFLGETFCFPAGEKLRVFFSYRFTRGQMRDFLKKARLTVIEDWIDASGEEGLFLCRRAAD